MKNPRRYFLIGACLGLMALAAATIHAASAQEDPSKYPTPADPYRRRLHARRRQRHHRADRRAEIVRKPRPARHHRQQAGRRRHRRHRICRQIGAGRLHAAGRRQRRDGDQSGRLCQAALRSGPRFRSGLRTRIVSADPDRQCVIADQVGRRACRLRQGQSGQDQLFQLVGRVPAGDRIVQAEDRRADAGDSLQGRRTIR